jgi:hypothetical protein
MSILSTERLFQTLDLLNELTFKGLFITENEKDALVDWLSSRQYRVTALAGFFRPTPLDQELPLRLFTGERIQTHFATDFISSIEAARALRLLIDPGSDLEHLLLPTEERISQACFASQCTQGECAHATIALLRYLGVGGLNRTGSSLAAFLQTIHNHQDGKGRWERLPFYYTLLALTEIQSPGAYAELQYAAPACEALIRKPARSTKVDERRRAVLERVLNRAASESIPAGYWMVEQPDVLDISL